MDDVLKINDAPTAMMLQDLTQIPVLTPQNPEIVIPANKLASLFYVDKDEDTMGVAIIYAQMSMYGSWMYSLDNGGSWTEESPDGGAGNNERKPNIIPFSKTKSQSIYSVFQSNVNVSTSTDKILSLPSTLEGEENYGYIS
ncbi:hypothetical protein Avbf_15499 [Armadillidium vulgare]|nr:hypothetical protein Avbf_15499 [Armadillidium vulgare]